MTAKPKAPALSADKEDHKKHADEFLEIEEYKAPPPGHPDEETETPTDP